MRIPRFSAVRLSRLGLSPWMLAGVACILILVMAGLSLRSNERERAFMVRNLTDRAEALIWALEAGTRTGMRMNAGVVLGLVPLLAETARQPGIVYMAVSDAEGRILAMSSAADGEGEDGAPSSGPPADGGALALPPLSAVTDRPAWRMRERADGGRVF
jgi:two-component system sensor histidine kinase HydH